MENEEFNIDYNDAESEMKALRELCTERGARMQVLFEIITRRRWYETNIGAEIDGWFDKDGVPL